MRLTLKVLQTLHVNRLNGDGYVDLSSYADEIDFEQDNTWNFNDMGDDDFGFELPPNTPNVKPKKSSSNKKNSHPVTGYSTDSAMNDLGLHTADNSQSRPIEHNAGAAASKFFPPPRKQKTTQRTPSAQLHEEAEYLERVLPADDFLDEIADAAAAEAEPEEGGIETPDELEAWFKAEFGTEHFNYIG